VTYVLESNIMMTTISLHFCSPHNLEVEDVGGAETIWEKWKDASDVHEKAAWFNEDKTINRKDEVKVVGESSRFLSFR
jgi:hypothetical protein